MNTEVKEILPLGKDLIIQMVLSLIDENRSADNFSKIKVMTNGQQIPVSL